MTLDNTTFEKVGRLLNIPCNTVEYCGVWFKNTTSFFVGMTDEQGNKISGIQLHVTEEFQIFKVQRINGYGIANVKGHIHKQFTWKLPIHPMGERPSFYSI